MSDQNLRLKNCYPQGQRDNNSRRAKYSLQPILIENESTNMTYSNKEEENLNLDYSFLVQKKSTINKIAPTKNLQTTVLNGTPRHLSAHLLDSTSFEIGSGKDRIHEKINVQDLQYDSLNDSYHVNPQLKIRRKASRDQIDKENSTSVLQNHLANLRAERKTLGDLTPNEYYNRIVADIGASETNSHPGSNSFIIPDPKRKLALRTTNECSLPKIRENLNSSIQILNQGERPLFDKDSLHYFEQNPHALDKLYMNYVDKRKTGRNGLERIEIPTFSSLKEKELSYNRKIQSNVIKGSHEQSRSHKKERSPYNKSQGLGVRFSLDSKENNSTSASRRRHSSPSGPGQKIHGDPKKKIPSTHAQAKKSKNRILPLNTSPSRSHSSVSRTSKDLDNSILSYLGYRGKLTPSNIVEKMINKSFDGSQVLNSPSHKSVNRPRTSTKSRRSSSHSQKRGEVFVTKDPIQARKEIERRYKLGTLDKSYFWNVIEEQLITSNSFRNKMGYLFEKRSKRKV